jgi:hypothetical protein
MDRLANLVYRRARNDPGLRLRDHRKEHPWVTSWLGDPFAPVWFVAENPSLKQVEVVQLRMGNPTPEDQWSVSTGDQLLRGMLIRQGYKSGTWSSPGGWRVLHHERHQVRRLRGRVGHPLVGRPSAGRRGLGICPALRARSRSPEGDRLRRRRRQVLPQLPRTRRPDPDPPRATPRMALLVPHVATRSSKAVAQRAFFGMERPVRSDPRRARVRRRSRSPLELVLPERHLRGGR